MNLRMDEIESQAPRAQSCAVTYDAMYRIRMRHHGHGVAAIPLSRVINVWELSSAS